MKLGVVAAVAGLALLAGLAWTNSRTGASDAGEATRVRLPAPEALGVPPAVTASPLPRSGLSHASPPDPEALRDAPARQAVYDAEARPGEFVTPPNVSVAR